MPMKQINCKQFSSGQSLDRLGRRGDMPDDTAEIVSSSVVDRDANCKHILENKNKKTQCLSFFLSFLFVSFCLLVGCFFLFVGRLAFVVVVVVVLLFLNITTFFLDIIFVYCHMSKSLLPNSVKILFNSSLQNVHTYFWGENSCVLMRNAFWRLLDFQKR